MILTSIIIILFFAIFLFVMLLGTHLSEVIEGLLAKEADEQLRLIDQKMNKK